MSRLGMLAAVVVAVAALWLAPAAGAAQKHYSLCTSPTHHFLCQDTSEHEGLNGEYVGHDEPSVEFYSHKPGSGYNMVYRLTLPKDPKRIPHQDGTGGTWNFELRATFWLGLTLCDGQSAPEYTHACTPRSDRNARYLSANPSSPYYIGKHPGSAYMELQFYEPGWIPQFNGFGCDATHYCANMTIDSYSHDENTDTYNNDDCRFNHFMVGDEPVNWAYVTKSGRAQAPANPLYLSGPNGAAGLNPDYKKDLLMNPGDRIKVWLHDTPAGFRVDIWDLTTGGHGSMTASKANGFGQVLFQPKAKTCHVRPYAFHAMFDTAVTRGDTWSAHTYNVAYSDEIGHFELCDAVDANFNCTKPSPANNGNPDAIDLDEAGCLPGAEFGALIPLIGCTIGDFDFDGQSYQQRWPGTFRSVWRDRALHPTPLQFTSPMSWSDGHWQNFQSMGFEADLPAIEGVMRHCDTATGRNCFNPPPGAKFYPFFSAAKHGGTCTWMEGGRYLPGATNRFGGSAHAEFGGLIRTLYASSDGPEYAYENFRRAFATNPCPA